MKNILTKIKHYEKDLFLSSMALEVEKRHLIGSKSVFVASSIF
ncbi:hypothetical protein [Helicobacter pylori]|nr:hypothetical protein [Helicobacter pylori]